MPARSRTDGALHSEYLHPDDLLCHGNHTGLGNASLINAVHACRATPVLTLDVRGEVETEESRGDAIWHEIHNAYRTRRILTGQLGGIEQTDNGCSPASLFLLSVLPRQFL